MKSNDIVSLLFAGVVVTFMGILLVGRFGGSAEKTKVEVEVIQPFEADFDEAGKSQLSDNAAARDFSVPIDLNSGLGNTNPFGQ